MNCTVEQLRKWLEQFPPDAWAYGYEGEMTGVVVVSKDTNDELGTIDAGYPSLLSKGVLF